MIQPCGGTWRQTDFLHINYYVPTWPLFLASLEGHLRMRRAVSSLPEGLPLLDSRRQWKIDSISVQRRWRPIDQWWTSGTYRTFFPFRPTHPRGSFDTPTQNTSSSVRLFWKTVAACLCQIHWFLSCRCDFTLCSVNQFSHATKLRLTFHVFFSFFNPQLNPCWFSWIFEKETVCKLQPCQNQRCCGLLDAWYYRTEDITQRFHHLTAFNVQYGCPPWGRCVCAARSSLSETAPDAWTPPRSLNIFVKSWGLAGTRRSSTIRLISHQREQMDADIERVASHLIWRGSAAEQKALNKACKTPQQTEGCYRNSSARKTQSLSSRLATVKRWKRFL